MENISFVAGVAYAATKHAVRDENVRETILNDYTPAESVADAKSINVSHEQY